jgi:hypothetical protein
MNQLLQDLIAAPLLKAAIFLLVPIVLAIAFLLSRPLQIVTIARNTFVESIRQPIYFVLIMLSGILQVFNTWGSAYSMGYSDTAEVSGDDKVLLDIGLATIFVCGMLLAAFIATAVISREIERKTVLTVVSKPISRTAVVLGKFLGVAGAMVIAIVTMVLFLLMGIRHGVMSTAADTLDMPVILFSGLAVSVAILAGAWCNFFYGWVFTQTSTLLMCPLMILAYLGVLLVSDKWELQSLAHDFKPQITLACISLLLAQLVITSIATAASARLGQVMTIVICAGLFVFGLLSNHFIGRRAFNNKFVARIQAVDFSPPSQSFLSQIGDTANVTLQYEPLQTLKVGMPFYFSPNPNGFPLTTFAFTPTTADYNDPANLTKYDLAPALVITSVQGRSLTVKHIGPDALLTRLPPQSNDFVFIRPTEVRYGAWAAWGIIPNVQYFWLVDAITQNQPVPGSHMALLLVYSITQIGAFLSLAVMLFQTREVG